MAAAAKSSGAARVASHSERPFATVLLAIAVGLLVLGAAGFGYLRTQSPMGLLSGGSRPIAAATVFVPAHAPLSVSLLTRVDRLTTLQEAVVSPEHRADAQREVQQLQRNLQAITGLDYGQDIQPWVGEEMTFAYTNADLDQNAENGQQPGYLLAVEIAPGARSRAQEFLQLFWQQQSLAGSPPISQRVSGVPILASSTPTAQLMGATAIVGSEFVLFSNAAEVIRSSIRAAQTADNLAQDSAYRTVADQLPAERIALAYFNTRLLRSQTPADQGSNPSRSGNDRDGGPRQADTFAAMSLGLTPSGLQADVKLTGSAARGPADAGSIGSGPNDMASKNASKLGRRLATIPESSQLVILGDRLDRLSAALADAGISTDFLPGFLTRLGPSQGPSPWQQVTRAGYTLAQLSGPAVSRAYASAPADWILSVAHTDAAINGLDAAAESAGYSVVPVQLGEQSAIAWTQFRAASQRRSTSSALETELLGLHLQQGTDEIFASSIGALERALAAPENSLARSQRFQSAIARLENPSHGYLYGDWPVLAPAVARLLPVFESVQRVARPLMDHIDAIAATYRNDTASIVIQIHE